jgi:hypothetical protein
MSKLNFLQRAEELKARLEQVKIDLLLSESPEEQRRLTALAASIQRSVRWYTARVGSQNDIHRDQEAK